MSVGDQADSKRNDIIKDNVVDTLGNNDIEKEEEDINRRTKLLQYEMQELKMRKIHLYMNKYKRFAVHMQFKHIKMLILEVRITLTPRFHC